MKTKLSLHLIILVPILGFLLLAMFLFGLWLLVKMLQEPELVGIVASLMILWLPLGMVFLFYDKPLGFEIKNGSLIISKFLPGKKTIADLSKVKYKEYDWGSRQFFRMNGVILEIEGMETVQYNKAAFRNADKFIGIIKESCKKDQQLKPRLEYKKSILFLTVVLVLLLLLVIAKSYQ